MLRRFGARFGIALLALVAASPAALAQFSVFQDPEATVFDLTGENGVFPLEFASSLQQDLIDLGSPVGLQSADIVVEGDGLVTFELIGGSVGGLRTAGFSILGELFASVSGIERVLDNGGSPEPIGPEVEVNEGDFLDGSIFSFLATVNSTGDLFSSASAGSQQVAVFVPSVDTLTGLNSVILSFEDALAFTTPVQTASGQTGFDDLIVSATFTQAVDAAEIPEPGTMLLLAFGLGAILLRVARRSA